jgi:hypothetical protein
MWYNYGNNRPLLSEIVQVACRCIVYLVPKKSVRCMRCIRRQSINSSLQYFPLCVVCAPHLSHLSYVRCRRLRQFFVHTDQLQFRLVGRSIRFRRPCMRSVHLDSCFTRRFFPQVRLCLMFFLSRRHRPFLCFQYFFLVTIVLGLRILQFGSNPRQCLSVMPVGDSCGDCRCHRDQFELVPLENIRRLLLFRPMPVSCVRRLSRRRGGCFCFGRGGGLSRLSGATPIRIGVRIGVRMAVPVVPVVMVVMVVMVVAVGAAPTCRHRLRRRLPVRVTARRLTDGCGYRCCCCC